MMFGRRRQVVQPFRGAEYNCVIKASSQLVRRPKGMPEMAWGPAGPWAGSIESAANYMPMALFFPPSPLLLPEKARRVKT